MDLIKTFKSEAERMAYVNEEVAKFDAMPEAHKHLICGSNSEYRARVLAATRVELDIPTPRDLTATEKAKLDGQVHHNEMLARGIIRSTSEDLRRDLPEAMRASGASADAEAFEKIVGPGRVAQNSLSKMIEDAINEALVNARKPLAPPQRTLVPLPERPSITPKWLVRRDSKGEIVSGIASGHSFPDRDEEDGEPLGKTVNIKGRTFSAEELQASVLGYRADGLEPPPLLLAALEKAAA